MSYNIRYGTADDGPDAWSERRDRLYAAIRAADPDILGVQEALRFQLDEMHTALPGYGEVGVGRDDGRVAGEYSAILYRAERFAVDTSGTFWLSATPSVPGSASWGNAIPRISTWALLRDRATNARLAVFNTHLDHESQPSRERGVQLIVDRIAQLAAGLPVIVTGDFNAGEDNAALAPLRAGGFVDTYRVRLPDATGTGTFNRFEGDSTGAKIDYIFVRGEWTVQAADILRRRDGARDPSDHFPVLARLELER